MAILARCRFAPVFLALCALAVSSVADSQNGLSAATEQLLRDPQLAQATVGAVVLDASTGEVVSAVNAGKSMVPASLMKVTTTATALAVLGEDYRFETQLCYTGTLIDGTLNGDLFIVGGGDPTLGAGRPTDALSLADVLSRWVEAVQAAGIRRITGRVVGEEGLDPGAEPSPYWQWNDIGNYYGAGAGALIINENQFAVRLQQRPRIGQQPTVVGYAPDPGDIRWTNELSSAGARSGDQSYIFGAPGTYDRVIRGTLPVGSGVYTVKASLPQPALHAATWLTEALRTAGIAVPQAPSVQQSGSPAEAVVLDVYRSPPLQEIVKLANFRSVNVIAEALYAALARAWNTVDKPSSTGEQVAEYWETQGVATDGWEQVDGAGLAMRNLITPQQLAEVLRRSPGSFRQNLPQVGAEGTVRGLARGKPGAQRLRVKSGTLKRARGFCGYATTAKGRPLVFTVLVNNHSGSGSALRRKLGQWMLALTQ